MYYLTNQEQNDIATLLKEHGFMNTDEILKTRADVSDAGINPLLEMFDLSHKEDLYYIFLLTQTAPKTWELSEITSAYQIPTLANSEGVHYFGKAYHLEDGPIPHRESMEHHLLQQARSHQMDDALKLDQNIKREFQAIGVTEYQQMLHKRGRHANLTYMRTKRDLSTFQNDALVALNNGYLYVHFEFVVAFASDVNHPYIAFVKASLGGRDLDKRADLPKVEKVFSKSTSGFPTLRQMSGALTATLEIKPIDVEPILRLFGNKGIRETGNLPSKKHGRGL